MCSGIRSFILLGTSGALQSWSAVNGADLSVIDTIDPLSLALPNSLQVVVPSNASNPVGFSNEGYFGTAFPPFLTFKQAHSYVQVSMYKSPGHTMLHFITNSLRVLISTGNV